MVEHVKSTMTILKVTVVSAAQNTQESNVKVRIIATENTGTPRQKLHNILVNLRY